MSVGMDGALHLRRQSVTVPAQNPIISHVASGATATFPYDFLVFEKGDLAITVDDNGVLPDDFSITGLGVDTGGNVTILTGNPAAGSVVRLLRLVPLERDTDYQQSGDFLSSIVNRDFDRIWQALQDTKRDSANSLRYPITEIVDGTLPAAGTRAGNLLGFDVNGRHAMIPVTASIGAGDMRVDVFAAGADFAPGLTTQLALSRAPGTPANAEVFFDSNFQGPDQWSVAGNLLTFSGAIPVGVSKVFVRLGTTLSTEFPPASSVGPEQLVWGNTLSRTVDSIAQLRGLSKTTYARVFATGYYGSGDGGGGSYWYDSADTVSADNGGTVIVSTDGARWKLVPSASMNVKQWGAKGDGSTNDTAALTRAAAWVAAKGAAGQSPCLVFPAGVYLYTTSPNWAAWNARIVPMGEVRLRCDGTGHSVVINGEGATNGRVYNMEFGPFIVEGESTTLDGVWVKQADHCKIKVNVRGAGATAAALRTLWCVASEFHFISSGNENPAAIGFYNNNAPLVGLALDGVGGSQTAYCTFYNPICERMPLGAVLGDALGNVFLGGAFEGCTSTGVQLSAGAIQNKFFGTDFEANTTYDVNCAGDGNEFHGCDTEKLIVFTSGAIRNKVVSGQHGDISLQAGANQNLVSSVTYNRFASGASITDSGANNRFRDNFNVGLGVYENVKSARVGIPVGASPFTYTNTSGNDLTVLITGGTVSATAIVRGANPGDSFTGGMVTLSPGDAVQVTYSSAPLMFYYTR